MYRIGAFFTLSAGFLDYQLGRSADEALFVALPGTNHPASTCREKPPFWQSVYSPGVSFFVDSRLRNRGGLDDPDTRLGTSLFVQQLNTLNSTSVVLWFVCT